MGLLFNIFKKRNLLNPEEPEKFYVVLRSRSTTSVEKMSEMVSQRLNVHKDFCRGVINCWNTVAVEQLLEGYCVDMGDVGYMYLNASSDGAATESEANARLVRNIKGRIRLSKKARTALKNATFSRAVKFVGGIDQEGEDSEL